jgi:bifunctional non-homologous end joining protein LigD
VTARTSDCSPGAATTGAGDGVDYKPLPLHERKARLDRLVDRRLAGIAMVDHTDARGEHVFEQACKMGLEGIVSKRLSKPYQSGRSGHWLKIKNPDSPAMIRARNHFARLER